MANMERSVELAKDTSTQSINNYLGKKYPELPITHEEFVEFFRNNATKSELWILGAIENHIGHPAFRKWVKETLLKSSFYTSDGNGNLVVK